MKIRTGFYFNSLWGIYFFINHC